MKKITYILISMFSLIFNVEALASTINISAAASLKDALEEIKVNYEKYSNNKLHINYGGSRVFALQIVNGALIDTFISADEKSINLIAEHKLLANKQKLLENTLVLVSYKDFKPQSLELNALTATNVKKIAIGNVKTVPAGRYALEALNEEQLFDKLQAKFIYTQNVRQALSYVVKQEVEFAFVYLSDYLIYKDDLQLICKVPTKSTIAYYMGVINTSKEADITYDFINYLQNTQSKDIFIKYGFNLR